MQLIPRDFDAIHALSVPKKYTIVARHDNTRAPWVQAHDLSKDIQLAALKNVRQNCVFF